MFQVAAASLDVPIDITLGSASLNLKALAPRSGAWTNGFVEQILKSDFDPARIRVLDGIFKGNTMEALASEQAKLVVSIDSQISEVDKFASNNDVGLIDFSNVNGGVSVSSPFVVAVTPLGGEKIEASVRLRQNGADSQSIFFYRVDKLTGMVDGFEPGEEGYSDAVKSRLYTFGNGSTSLEGPGHGLYREDHLIGVNSGDMIAMGLINHVHNHVFYGFAKANEVIADSPINHLRSYGKDLNAFGFEDTFGGGDYDFNDTVFSLSFADPFASSMST